MPYPIDTPAPDSTTTPDPGTPPAGDPPAGDPPPVDDAPKTDDAPAGDPPKSDDPPKTDDAPDKSEGKDSEKKADDAKNEGAPEQYEAFTLPDGVQADQALMDAFTPLAKELGLSQEQAQKLVTMQAERELAMAQERSDNFEATRNGWIEAAENDKEIGGEDFEPNLAIANKALDEYATDELKEVLDDTGLGDHPEFFRLFYKIGKLMEDDQMHVGSPARNTNEGRLAAMFPSMQK